MARTKKAIGYLSQDKALLYGLPNAGVSFTRKGYRLDKPWCVVCGKPSQTCHHIVPRHNGLLYKRDTEHGTFILRSPLIALCGSGTTGCHNDFHGGARLHIRWVWDEPEFAKAWEDGSLLKEFGPDNPQALYHYGQWQIEHSDGWVKLYREVW